MSNVQNNCPAELCEQFTRNELEDLKAKKIWSSWHPVMERILHRKDEMRPVYEELAASNGVHLLETCSAFRLILEAVWSSGDQFSHETISRKKQVAKELSQLQQDISKLSTDLGEALRRQKHLIETEEFSKHEYLGCVDLLNRASYGNGHYSGWVKGTLESLDSQFDGKYWPEPEDIVLAIGEFEREIPVPEHYCLPSEVMAGRSSVLKDFVLGLDEELDKSRQIPRSFKFSNKSMASIINVVLDLSLDLMATEDNVRVIRHRRKSGKY